MKRQATGIDGFIGHQANPILPETNKTHSFRKQVPGPPKLIFRKVVTMKNKVTAGVALGFALGALFGVFMGMNNGDLALWLSVGIGAGMALGAAAGVFMGRGPEA